MATYHTNNNSWRGPPLPPQPTSAAVPPTSNAYHYYPVEHSGPRAKCDQVVFEAIAKAAEIIVTSRCPCASAGGGGTTSQNNGSAAGSRFNLQAAGTT